MKAYRNSRAPVPMPPNPYSAAAPTTKAKDVAENHLDVDALIEDYTWHFFADMVSMKRSGLDQFKNLTRQDVEFKTDRKRLVVIHSSPQYATSQLSEPRPNTIFKSVFTNKTSQAQSYSLKTERTSESICAVAREQGFMFGAEAELTLKTPCEIAELKTGFKHEIQFADLTENTKSEVLTWGVDSNIIVNPDTQCEASIIIEEVQYHGSYQVTSTLFGVLTTTIHRRSDGARILPVTANIATIFQHCINTNNARVKRLATVANNKVEIVSKGTCHFQFAMKQYVDLKEVAIDEASHLKRLNLHESTTRFG